MKLVAVTSEFCRVRCGLVIVGNKNFCQHLDYAHTGT